MSNYKHTNLINMDLNWEALVPYIGRSNANLAKYAAFLETLPNPEILLSPLKVKEAVISSKIEGTQATLEDVLKYDIQDYERSKQNEDIKQVLNYRNALLYAEKELIRKPININMIKRMHHLLLDDVTGMDKSRGDFREAQNWIGSEGTTLEEATYVPPEWQKVKEYMYELEKFINHDFKDYIVQLAIIHVQFEMIHPFLDGNGRIGRILIPLFLYQRNLLPHPSFYISEYFESDRSMYYDKLSSVSIDHNWEIWIIYFLKAVDEQAKKNCTKIRDIHNLYNRLKEVLTVDINTTYGIKVLDALFSSPYFTTSSFRKNTQIPARTCRRLLSAMEDRKIIKVIEKSSGPKPTFYIFPELLGIVNR